MNKKFKYHIQIKESHLDTFGHVNNAAYLTILEEARWELITENGFGLKEVHERKKGPVILEVTLKFIKELKLREDIVIETFVEKYEGKIGIIKQNIYKPDNVLGCEATFVFGFFDLVTRKLIEPTQDWLKAIGLS
jgi:YbgC/YbaW family acyl-CoA thioester hydrolase